MSKIVVTFEVERHEPRADGSNYPDKTTLAMFEIEADGATAISVYQEALTKLTSPTVAWSVPEPEGFPMEKSG